MWEGDENLDIELLVKHEIMVATKRPVSEVFNDCMVNVVHGTRDPVTYYSKANLEKNKQVHFLLLCMRGKASHLTETKT